MKKRLPLTEPLARLRRYQQLLIIGGGTVITIVVLIANLLEAAMLVSSHVARTSDEVSQHVRDYMDFTARSGATMRNTVQTLQIAWDSTRPDDTRRHVAFGANGGIVAVTDHMAIPTLFVLSNHFSSTVQRYLHLADQLTGPVTTIAARNEGQLSAYLYSRDGQTVLLTEVPWPGDVWEQRIGHQRQKLLQALTAIDARATWAHKPTGKPLIQWLPPYTSPLTGVYSARLVTAVASRTGEPIGTLVYELPISVIESILPHDRFSGRCMVLAPDGSLIAACSEALPSEVALASSALARNVSMLGPYFSNGYLLQGWRLGNSGWTFVYMESWRDVLAGIAPELLVSLLAATLVIVAAWTVLTLTNRRLLGPALQQQLTAEQELRKARKAADSANAAKSVFLATMSHEIRTPLNAILGNLELLSHTPLNPRQRCYLATLCASSDGLLELISDVLDFSKIEAGELRLEDLEFDAQEVLSHALSIFFPTAAARGLNLCSEFGAEINRPMRGDPTRLRQIINNLLSNAIKFTTKGTITLRLLPDNMYLIVEVEDTGIGIAKEQQQRLFRAFSQADDSIHRRFGGTGLGLALSARLTKEMQGEITVRSELGKGSCFSLKLPLGHFTIQPELPRFAGEKVLLVSASGHQRELYSRLLRIWNMSVSTYEHPAQLKAEELEEAHVLILWGNGRTWHHEDEEKLAQQVDWQIDALPTGPQLPLRQANHIGISVFDLRSLNIALRHVLRDDPLPQIGTSRMIFSEPLSVLVAEDNPVNRQLFEEQLALLNCRTRVVSDAEQALTLLRQMVFDVLLTDLAMPEMDGYILAREVKQHWPELPIIAVTANVTQEEKTRGIEAGMSMVLAKPLSLDALGAALAEVCKFNRPPPCINSPILFWEKIRCRPPY